MEYKVETSLHDFPAWQGGKDTLDTIIERDDCQEVEDLIETVFFDQDATDEDINDFLWFERDQIAEHLGYRDWDAYEDGETESEEEDFLDMNGTPIQVGDTVAWDDEAGENEDGSMGSDLPPSSSYSPYTELTFVAIEKWCEVLSSIVAEAPATQA